MKEKRAREILVALVQGIDPFSGEELPTGTVLQQADVLRAMLAGIAAMEEKIARDTRREQLPKNIGKTWSEDEVAQLVAAFQAGEPLETIADRMGRTLGGVESRLEKLGLITAAERKTRNHFGAEGQAA